jgi:hypothetical protein
MRPNAGGPTFNHQFSNRVFDDRLSGPRFDYESLPPSVANFLRGQADRIRRQCASSIIHVGKALLEAKRHLSHGAFLCWVEHEVGLPARTAQVYMRAASWSSGKGATVAHLSPSALYLLSTNGVPEEFIINVLDRVAAGEQIAPAALREELKTFRSNSKEGLVAEAEICARQVSSDDRKWETVAPESEARTAIVELVSILTQALSTEAFARVREIVTSDVVLSDPQLALILERAFSRVS